MLRLKETINYHFSLFLIFLFSGTQPVTVTRQLRPSYHITCTMFLFCFTFSALPALMVDGIALFISFFKLFVNGLQVVY